MKMNRNEKNNDLLPVITIVLATHGDEEAILEVLNHYEHYINTLCQKKVVDAFGNAYQMIDEEMKQRVQVHLITTLSKFNVY